MIFLFFNYHLVAKLLYSSVHSVRFVRRRSSISQERLKQFKVCLRQFRLTNSPHINVVIRGHGSEILSYQTMVKFKKKVPEQTR